MKLGKVIHSIEATQNPQERDTKKGETRVNQTNYMIASVCVCGKTVPRTIADSMKMIRASNDDEQKACLRIN